MWDGPSGEKMRDQKKEKRQDKIMIDDG